ncbi:SDR family NAD(P)-dependent oxidoreductase [Pedobacter frigidisoli]|uniref:SDR family NAD(P)-dependent oxidoreductase n=1 Tax=Pedobacter frigidisoli TaxID=2530455 RepID=A0A4R0P217_9SPHI|nr:oxidoreductase [Pedobacter frigidisoli]TCD07657.1 SDR family NAD(P)-dependent oxidoreductase [Pedobacter frigidisoli]
MWTKKDMPDLTGKTAIVTGANTGLGFETALALYEAGAHVILACRNEKNAQQTKSKLESQASKGTLEIGIIDLSSLKAVKQFADTFLRQHDQLHILINNAGVANTPESKTAEDYELQFGVNFLAHFALTGYLFPVIEATKGSRVITVSSMGYEHATIDFENLKLQKGYNALREYRQSKLANLLFSLELQRRITKMGYQVLSVAAQPGANDTDLLRHSSAEEMLAGKERIGQFMEPAQGALSALYAAVSDKAKGGNMYEPDQGFRGYPVLATLKENALDKAVANKLWGLA